MAEDYVGRGATYLTTSDTRLLLDASRALLGRVRKNA